MPEKPKKPTPEERKPAAVPKKEAEPPAKGTYVEMMETQNEL